jgi:hypothetical protein
MEELRREFGTHRSLDDDEFEQAIRLNMIKLGDSVITPVQNFVASGCLAILSRGSRHRTLEACSTTDWMDIARVVISWQLRSSQSMLSGYQLPNTARVT